MQKLHRNEQKIYIPGPSGRIEAQIAGFNITPDPEKDYTPKAVAVVCHPHPLYQGTMHNKVVTAMIRAWQSLNIATVRFNFRGVGESEGQYGNETGEVEDLKWVIQWVNTFCKEKNIIVPLWLGGFSFGALISAKVASAKVAATMLHIDLLLSIAPVMTHFQLLGDDIPNCPWVIITGEKDELIDYKVVENKVLEYKKNNKNQYIEFIIMPAASHFFHGKLIELEQKIKESTCNFLTSH